MFTGEIEQHIHSGFPVEKHHVDDVRERFSFHVVEETRDAAFVERRSRCCCFFFFVSRLSPKKAAAPEEEGEEENSYRPCVRRQRSESVRNCIRMRKYYYYSKKSNSDSDSDSDSATICNSPSSYRQPSGNGQLLSRRYCKHSGWWSLRAKSYQSYSCVRSIWPESSTALWRFRASTSNSLSGRSGRISHESSWYSSYLRSTRYSSM